MQRGRSLPAPPRLAAQPQSRDSSRPELSLHHLTCEGAASQPSAPPAPELEPPKCQAQLGRAEPPPSGERLGSRARRVGSRGSGTSEPVLTRAGCVRPAGLSPARCLPRAIWPGKQCPAGGSGQSGGLGEPARLKERRFLAPHPALLIPHGAGGAEPVQVSLLARAAQAEAEAWGGCVSTQNETASLEKGGGIRWHRGRSTWKCS